MSKINGFRVVNLNYNNNANKIEDEIFHFDGNSTLLSLQNGGGKTVLVQMLMAPFVHKRFRNTTDRPFESFFSSALPTFLLVEWRLDGEAGYVLTGMMVRKSQGGEERENTEELEIVNFIHEYKEANPHDIHQFPIIEYEGSQKKLKNFHATKKMFEEIRQERGGKFQAFDMNQSNQQRQYFVRLKEYGINYEEWESIIKKINLKESGLSDLFKEAKDEYGLVERWFLPAIEVKLNKEENRMKQFRELLLKFLLQYKENEVKIKRKEIILNFASDGEEIEQEAVKALELLKETEEIQDKIAYLRHSIVSLLEQAEKEEEHSKERLRELEFEREQVRFEEVSYQLYQLLDELDQLFVEQNQVFKQMEEQKEKQKEISKNLHIQQCAREYENYKEEEYSVLNLENKYDIMKKEEEELLPERQNLGYSLHLAYAQIEEGLEEEIYKIQEELKTLSEEQGKLQLFKGEEESTRSKLGEELGVRRTKVSQYEEMERRFNKRFSYQLERNIIGTYEEGIFEELFAKGRSEEERFSHELLAAHQEKQKREEEENSLDRKIQDFSSLQGRLSEVMRQIESKDKKYKEELELRLGYMKYLDIPEEKWLEQELICNKFREKTESLRKSLRLFEREKEELTAELEKMKHGVVLEIPKEFEELLLGLDINYVTGMDYLKHHKELAQRIPILPFSIIMSNKELLRLSNAFVDFYTSYPIPILTKEQISLYNEVRTGAVQKEEKLSFFIFFNKQLLEEEELKKLLAKKEKELEEIGARVDKRLEEIHHYETMGNIITYQEVNTASYNSLKKEQEDCKTQNKEASEKLKQLRIDRTNNDSLIEKLTRQCEELEALKQQNKQMQEALLEMKEGYERYLEDYKQVDILNRQIQSLSVKIQEKEKQIKDSYERLSDKKADREQLDRKKEEARHNKIKYVSYTQGEQIQKDLVDIETRYRAITEKMNQDIQLVEEQIKEARVRFIKTQDELIRLSEKYSIAESEYKEVRYSQLQEKEWEKQLNNTENLYKAEERKWNTLDKYIAVKEDNISSKKREIKERFEKETPIPKESIIDISFQARIKVINMDIEKEKECLQKIIQRKNGYEANRSGLSEFSNLVPNMEYDFLSEMGMYQKSSLDQLSGKEMEEMYGNLIRTYRSLKEKRAAITQNLERLLDNLMRKESYKEDFYRQPLTLMMQLTKEPEELLKQLSIILKSYDTLLQKLEVDIAFVDREKRKIVEMIFDYTGEIHKNLSKIDKNSTITVKERSIKMLRVQVPDWDENREIYLQRTNTFIEELIKTGLLCLADNQNAEEMIGLRLTSKAVYDSIIGIGTTGIKLYKIEAQREYPITWTEVSKNSGGEGFLSAFVVLTCLLSYMRRDESDLFVEREEGKVIVMDNPFAQTNASHLLIPLMDIAKKYNTQLICLTGLGGESIYNRFENIYVLNLVESGLKRGISYLKADHIKGDAKVYHLSTARVQIEEGEQMELLF